MEFKKRINLEGKVAVVTGGAGALGAMFARALAAQGAKVAILDLADEKAKEIAEEINASGGEAIGVKADVLDRDKIEESHKEVLEKLGKCDILINCAGGNHPSATCSDDYFDWETVNNPEKKSFFDLELRGIKFVADLNYIGTIIPTQAFAYDMCEKGAGNIINIASVNAFLPLTRIPSYSAMKAGIANLTKWMAVHFAPAGIRVNCIAPGFVSSAQNAALLWNPDGTPTARSGKILAGTPMKRFGQPEELAGPLLWLVDDETCSFVTGAVLPVDGGFTAYSGV